MLTNLLEVLIDFALFGGLILLVGCLAMQFFKQPIERLRIIEWTLAGCLLAPLLQQIPGVPRWSLGLWPREEVAAVDKPLSIETAPVTHFVPPQREPPMPVAVAPIESPQPSHPALSVELPASAAVQSRFQWSWPLAIAIAFAAGSLGMAAWLLVGMMALWRIARRSQPAPERIGEIFRTIAGGHKSIRLHTTDRLQLPIAFGLLRPTILLPKQLCESATDNELRFCLAHEYAHLCHADLWRWRICTLAGLVFFYQPLYWHLRRQLRLVQDFLADHQAALTADATDYASFLLTLAKHRLGLAGAAGLSIGDGRSNLYCRVTTLLSSGTMLNSVRRRRSFCFALLAIGLIGLFSTVRFGLAEANDDVGEKLDHYSDRLPEGASLRMGTVRLRHTSSVNGVTFTPDGKTLVSCGWDHPIRLWDAETGKPIRELLDAVDCGTFGAAFSPDGTRLAAVCDQGLVRMWDFVAAKEVWNRKTGGERVYGVAYSRDGKYVASAGREQVVHLWDAATGEPLADFESDRTVHDSHAVAFSPDGKRLACGATRRIRIYDLEQSREQIEKTKASGGEFSVATISESKAIAIKGEIFSLAFTADSKHIAAGGPTPTLWRIDDGKKVREFKGKQKNDSRTALAISKDGTLLASVGMKAIHIWKVENGQLVRTISDYYNSFGPRTHAIAISPDNKTVATIGPHHTILAWDIESGERKLWFADSHLERVECVACSPKEPIVASGSADGDVRIWELKTGKHLRVFRLGEGEPGWVHDVKFSPDGAYVAAGGYDWKEQGNTGLVSVWRVSDDKPLWSTRVNGRVTSLDYSIDGKLLAVAAGLGDFDFDPARGQPCSVSFLEAASGQEKSKWIRQQSRTTAIRILPDGQKAIVVDQSKSVCTWDLIKQEQVAEFVADGHSRQIQSGAYSADGRTLVTSGLFENLLVLWDTKTGIGLKQIEIEKGKGSMVALSPDGKRLAAGSISLTTTDHEYKRSIQLWNTETGKRLANFDTGLIATSSLTFSPDGHKLISGMDNGTLLVWDVDQVHKQSEIDRDTQPKNGQRSRETSASTEFAKADSDNRNKAAEPFTYTGVVQDKKTGKPITGAAVRVRLTKDQLAPSSDMQESKHTTDAKGEYTFTIPGELAARDLVYSQTRIEHPGYATNNDSYFLDLARKRGQPSPRRLSKPIELRPGKAVTGVVTTPDGKPAANVIVRGYSEIPRGADKLPFEFGKLDLVKTDEQGRFSLTMLDPGVGIFWILPQKDYAPSQHFVGEKRGDMGTIVLQSGQSISGKLLDAEGKPVPGVYVTARTNRKLPKDFAISMSDQISRLAISDANGEFKMPPLGPGKYSLQTTDEYADPWTDLDAWPKRKVPPAVFLPKTITLVDGEQIAPVEFRAVPHVLIKAQSVDSQGRPRSGFLPDIGCRLERGFFATNGELTPQGELTALVPRGSTEVHMFMNTDQYHSFRWRLDKDKPWQVGHDMTIGAVGDGISGIEIMYFKAPLLTVKVVDDEGKTRKDADVTAFYAKGVLPHHSFTRKRIWPSDVNFEEESMGDFRSICLLPDEEITLTANADGLKSQSEKLTLDEGEKKEITLILKKAAPEEIPKSAEGGNFFWDVSDEEAEPEKPKAEVGPMPGDDGGAKGGKETQREPDSSSNGARENKNEAVKPKARDERKSDAHTKEATKAAKPQPAVYRIDVVVQRTAGKTNLINSLPESLWKPMQQIPGVKRVLYGSVDLISFNANVELLKDLSDDLLSIPINGWPEGSGLFDRLNLIEGRKLQRGDRNKAMLGHELAVKLKKKVGDKVPIYGNEFEIVGIFESIATYENGSVVITLDEMQRGNNTEGAITGFTVQVEDRFAKPDQLQEICKQIEAIKLDGLPAGSIKAKPVSEIFRGDIEPPETPER